MIQIYSPVITPINTIYGGDYNYMETQVNDGDFFKREKEML